jgi:hypothetical protein
MRLPVFVASLVDIASGEGFPAKPMFQEAHKLPFVLLSVFDSVHSIAINLPQVPLPDVALSLVGLPISASMFFTVFPLPFVILSVVPVKLAFAVAFAFHEVSFVFALFCFFYPMDFLVIEPNPLEQFLLGEQYPLPVFLVVFDEPKVELVFVE